MTKFYKPFVECVVADDLPTIVYPAKDSNPLDKAYRPPNRDGLVSHLDELYEHHPDLLHKGQYHIAFCWAVGSVAMSDVWIHDIVNGTGSGPLVNCYTFEGTGESDDVGVASADTLMILGREAELFMRSRQLSQFLLDRETLLHLPGNIIADSFGE